MNSVYQVWELPPGAVITPFMTVSPQQRPGVCYDQLHPLTFSRANPFSIPFQPAGQIYPLRFPYEMPQPWELPRNMAPVPQVLPAQQLVYMSAIPYQQPVYFWNGVYLTQQ